MTTFSTAKTGCIGTTILCWFNPMELRLIGCTVLILALPCFGQSSMERRLECLSAVETRDNDLATGKAGEVSRYAICPSVWRQYAGKLPLEAARNPITARKVTLAIMDARTRHKPVSDEIWAILWHCPGAIGRLTPKQADFAQRFANLCSKPLAKP